MKMSDIVERLRGVAHTYDEYGVHSDTELEAATEIEKLRAALRPFAGMADYCEGDSDSESACVFVGDLRQARAVLGEKK